MVKRGGRFDPLPLEDPSSKGRLMVADGEAGSITPLRIQPLRRSWTESGSEQVNGGVDSVSNLQAANTASESQTCQAASASNGCASGKHKQTADGASDKGTANGSLDPAMVDGDQNDDDALVCGLGRFCSPGWLQRFASKQMFLAVFCLACVLQGMFYTYFVSVLTTIEKLFQIQSKTTGIIMSATEIGQIGGSLILTYYGGQGHRPKWIGWGMVLFAASSFLCSLPHFIFWRVKPITGQTSNELILDSHQSTAIGSHKEMDLVCRQLDAASKQLSNWTMGGQPNSSAALPFSDLDALSLNEQCASSSEQQTISRTTTMVLAIFFLSLLGIGMGRTAVDTLGIPYIDDNVATRESPTYFAITIGVKILGPVFGFILGSLCTSLYVDPFAEPDVTSKDPRWIGAWWLGMIAVSTTIFLSSFFMFAFPRRLPKKNGTRPPAAMVTSPSTSSSSSSASNGKSTKSTVQTSEMDGRADDDAGQCASPLVPPSTDTQTHNVQRKNPSLKDFPKAVRRLLKNDILLYRTASSVLHILPIAGLYTFLPKYLESQFRLTATVANMISGIGGILVMGFGIFFSGVFIRIWKPSPKFVAAWIALTALLYAIGMGLLMLMGCPMDDFASLVNTEAGKQIQLPCNRSCECDTKTFAPICTSTGETYFSACHAGCTNLTYLASETGAAGPGLGDQQYSNCQCLDAGVTATSGFCQLECNNFIWYIGLFSLFVLIHSTSEVGSMLLTLRCVQAKDKAMAMGLIQFAIGLFANVPCPIIYGAVVDSACLVWEETCGEQGACWLYDSTIFRIFFHGMTGVIMLIAFFVDVVVWYKADQITFAEDEPPPPSVEMEEMQPIRTAVQYESTI